jgi:hypothetical protein
LQAAVVWEPAVQTVVQTVPEGQSAQAPAVQVPLVPQLVWAVVVQTFRGSGPLLTPAQVPLVPPVSAAEQA